MEGLLPLIIMIILSVVLSAKKKKRPQLPPDEAGDAPTGGESPWDDLMRELRKVADPTAQEEVREASEPEEEHYEEEPTPMPPARSILEPAAPTPEPEPRYFSYDEAYEPEPRVFSYENYEDHIPAEPTVHKAAVSAIVSAIAAPAEEPEPEAKADTKKRDEGVFADGFDARMAVLYSEVFRPKYLD